MSRVKLMDVGQYLVAVIFILLAGYFIPKQMKFLAGVIILSLHVWEIGLMQRVVLMFILILSLGLTTNGAKETYPVQEINLFENNDRGY